MSGITTTNPQSARLALLQGRRFLNNLTAWISLGVLLLLLIFSLFPEVLSPYDPIRQRIVSRLENPSMTHLFGTDELGRDIFSRVIHGSRVSVGTAVLAVLFGVPSVAHPS